MTREWFRISIGEARSPSPGVRHEEFCIAFLQLALACVAAAPAPIVPGGGGSQMPRGSFREEAGANPNASNELSMHARRLYRESSVFVFPSEREGSPTVVQEAMSAGLAVVAADAAGTPEVVGDAGGRRRRCETPRLSSR